jgi:hypothetical protein
MFALDVSFHKLLPPSREKDSLFSGASPERATVINEEVV